LEICPYGQRDLQPPSGFETELDEIFTNSQHYLVVEASSQAYVKVQKDFFMAMFQHYNSYSDNICKSYIRTIN
jgi:hypothetical protein